ncbi:MAG TPA: FAD-dependent monooxygenase [Pseudonocardiaceae bacterium]
MTDVVVVGAGVTGLMLGTELGLAGVQAVVIDALPAPSRQAKGGGVQPRTAEIFDLRGMMDPLRRHAVPGEPVSGHFGGLPVPLDCRPWRTRHLWPVQIPQSHIEEFLATRLARHHHAVRRGHQLTAIEPGDHSITAVVHDHATGTDLRVGARYLVACDGAHSTVRTLLGVGFPGEPGTRTAVLADIRLTSVSGLVPTGNGPFAAMVRDGGGYWSMLNPLDAGRYRFVFGPLEPTDTERRRDRPVSPGEVRNALRAVWGPDTELGEITSSSRFSDAVRQVERYRAGRVLFAGDAAHVHPPLGGQGLNLGIQDAFNLGWKLAAEVHGHAPDGLLDSYHTERHPAAGVLHHVRAQRVLAERRPSADVAALRDIVTDLARLPDANRHLAGMISGLDLRYPMPSGADHPLLGARIPDIELVIDGAPTRVSALMHTGRGLLLDLTGADRLAGYHHAGVDLRSAVPAEQIDATAVLVRPDGHICWLCPAEPMSGLDAALQHWFGPARHPGVRSAG